MEDIILKALDTLEDPVIILDRYTREIIYTNRSGKNLIFEIEKQGICLKLDLWEEKSVILSLDYPRPQVFFGKCKLIDEKFLLIVFSELRKDKPFSGFLFELLEELPLLVFLIKDGRIVYVNKSIEYLLGFSREELLGKNLLKDLIWPLDRPRAELHCKRVQKGIKEESVIIALIDKNGKPKNFLWNCLLTSDWEGDPIIVSIASDISEYLELSQKIERLYKTQTFSEFLRGLVHDFNNVLNTIQSYLKKLRSTPSTQMEDILFAIERTINIWIDINRILLDFTRETKELRLKKIDMVSFLKENLEIFAFLVGEKINIYLDLGFYKSLYTYGDIPFWRYIFLNLFSNAKDAMQGEGKIFISLNKYVDKTKDKKYLKITFKDTGPGIPEEILSRIFEPFFTTKEKGSGLGLFLIKHHIKSLEGFIEVESQPGQGAAFYLYVPLCLEECIQVQYKEEDFTGRVFYIVEDDKEVGTFLQKILTEKGAKCYYFISGEDYLERGSQILPPDLALIDFNLQGMSGKEVEVEIRKRFPNCKVLYLTGDIFVLSEIPEENLLLKPFKLEDLFKKINLLLNE